MNKIEKGNCIGIDCIPKNLIEEAIEDKIEIEELNVWEYEESYLCDILNKEYPLEDAISDIKRFRNTKYYTGTKEKYKVIKEKIY
jgi:hypothetical protein